MENGGKKFWERYKNVAAVRGLLDWVGLWKGLAAAMTAIGVWFVAWLRHLAGVEQFVLALGVFAFVLIAINGALAVRDRFKMSKLPVPESAKSGSEEIEPQPIVEKPVPEEKWLALYREKQQLEDELESLELPEPEGSWNDRPIRTAGEIASGPLRRMTYSESYEYEKRDRRIQRIKKELAFIDKRLKDHLR
jgi:hypothetical protein